MQPDLAARLADLDVATTEFLALFEGDTDLWAKRRPRKWSSGQHAEHVAIALEKPLELMAESLAKVRRGALGSPPRRGPLQWLFVRVVVEGGRMPRGGRARPFTQPADTADRDAVLARIRQAPVKYRAFVAGLDTVERDQLWFENPFSPLRWHYRLHEIVRIQAVHLRHHGKQIAELRAG